MGGISSKTKELLGELSIEYANMQMKSVHLHNSLLEGNTKVKKARFNEIRNYWKFLECLRGISVGSIAEEEINELIDEVHKLRASRNILIHSFIIKLEGREKFLSPKAKSGKKEDFKTISTKGIKELIKNMREAGMAFWGLAIKVSKSSVN